MQLAEYRPLFPVTREHAFFNHAATAAPSLRATQAAGAFLAECGVQGSLGYRAWMTRLAGVRASAARLLGVEPEEIAFVPNTSTGLATIAEGFPWQAGDAVLVPVPDFPANVYPWEHLARRGVQVIHIPRRAGRLDADDLEAALTPAVRLVVLSSVDYVSGYATDLVQVGALCRARGIALAVDAIQSLGVLPLDVRACSIDFLAAGGHKWLTGPVGTGLLFVRREWCGHLTPPLVGWKSVTDPENFSLHFELRDDAARFEPGTLNLPGLFALGAAIELLLEVGLEPIRARVFALLDRLAAGLGERGLALRTRLEPEVRSGILTFVPRGDPLRLFHAFAAQGVILSPRGDGLRLSPHFYNDDSDVERFFRVLDQAG